MRIWEAQKDRDPDADPNHWVFDYLWQFLGLFFS